MENELRALLKAHAPLTDLVGSAVYWDERPQGKDLPAVVLTLVSDASEHSIDGPDQLSTARVQIDCFAETSKEKIAIAKVIRAHLAHRSQGVIDNTIHLQTRDSREGEKDQAGIVYRRSLDFNVSYHQA